MRTAPTVYLVRGFPGSGRTSAVEELRQITPGLVFIDADPQLKGDAFSDLEAHAESLRRATDDIRRLVQHKTRAIAVETCAPRAADVNHLLVESRRAGYRIQAVAPVGALPDDLIYCFERSSHEPDPTFLANLASEWQEFEAEPVMDELAPNPAERHARRKAAWAAFSEARAASSKERSDVLIAELEKQFPDEARDLMLSVGPTWGRSILQSKAPVYPLASVSPYWAEIQKDRLVALNA